MSKHDLQTGEPGGKRPKVTSVSLNFPVPSGQMEFWGTTLRGGPVIRKEYSTNGNTSQVKDPLTNGFVPIPSLCEITFN